MCTVCGMVFEWMETICSIIQSGTPEDGHNGARNM